MFLTTTNCFVPPKVKSSLRLPPKVAAPRSSLVLHPQPQKQQPRNHYIFWDLDNVRPTIAVPSFQGDPQHFIRDSLDAIHIISNAVCSSEGPPLKLSHASVVANTATWSNKPWCITNTKRLRPNIFIAKTSQGRKQSADVELTKLIIGQLVILKGQGRLHKTNNHLPVFTLVSGDNDFLELMEHLSSKLVTVSMTMHSLSFKRLGSGCGCGSSSISRGKYPVRTSKLSLDRGRLAQAAHHTASFALNSTEYTQAETYSDDNSETGQCNRKSNSLTPPFVLHDSWTNPKYLC